MIQDFLQNRIAGALKEFIEFEISQLTSLESLTIRNSKIKPALIQHLAQLIWIPLELVEGSITNIVINKPWSRIFLLANSPIKIVLEGIRLRTKLLSRPCQKYLLRTKADFIEKLTASLKNPFEQEKRGSPWVHKIREYFLGSIRLQIKDLVLEICADFQEQVDIILKFDTFVLTSEKKPNIGRTEKQLQIVLTAAKLSYRTLSQRQQPLIFPMNLTFRRDKISSTVISKLVSKKQLVIEHVSINITNHTFNILQKLFMLIRWHNSFIDLPQRLWKIRPILLKQHSPIDKFRYGVQLMVNRVKDMDVLENLRKRRRYLATYEKVEINAPDAVEAKTLLQEMEKQMPVWKIIAYRKYYINKFMQKERKETLEAQQNGVKPSNSMSFQWMKFWLKTETNKEEPLIKEIKSEMDKSGLDDEVDALSRFEVRIDEIQIKLLVTSIIRTEPFLNIIATHCRFIYTKQIQRNSDWSLIIMKLKVDYDKSLGYNKRYCHFLSQSDHLSSPSQESQFEEIQHFFEWTHHNGSRIVIQPVQICFNHQTVEKLVLFKMKDLSKDIQTIEQRFLDVYDPEEIIEEERARKNNQTSGTSPRVFRSRRDNQRQDQIDETLNENPLTVSTALSLLIPQSLAEYSVFQMCLLTYSINLIKRAKLTKLSVTNLVISTKHISQTQQETLMAVFVSLDPIISTKIFLQKCDIMATIMKSDNYKQVIVKTTPLRFMMNETPLLEQIIELLYCLLPKKIPVQQKIRHLSRRKQSIGEEFIDAFENMYEQLKHSAISSDKVVKKNIAKDSSSLKLIAIIDGCDFFFESIMVKMSPITAQWLASQDTRHFQSKQELSIRAQIINPLLAVENLKEIQVFIKKQQVRHRLGYHTHWNPRNSLEIANVNFTLVFYNKKCSGEQVRLQLNLNHIIQAKENSSRRIQATIEIFYLDVPSLFFLQGQRSIAKQSSQQIKPCSTETSLLESITLEYEETKGYNLHSKTLKCSPININIKPSALKLCSLLISESLSPENASYTITNLTNTVIRMNGGGNSYKEYHTGDTVTIKERNCALIVFGCKFNLNFHRKTQQLQQPHYQKLSQHIFLIIRQEFFGKYVLESNLKLTNYQQKTIWVRISEQKGQLTRFNDQIKQRGNVLDQRFVSNTAYRSFSIDNRANSIEYQGIVGSVDYRATSMEYLTDNEINKAQSHNFSIAPNKTVEILLNTECQKLQVIDYGVSFKPITISSLFENKELILQSQENHQQSLVLRCKVSRAINTNEQIENRFLEYEISILSPVYLVNRLPWELEYHLYAGQVLSESRLNRESIVQSLQRSRSRRKSMVQPLQKIPVLGGAMIRDICPQNIDNLEIKVLNYSQRFNLRGLISKLLSKNTNSESLLVTLTNAKKHIQLVFSISLTQHTLKFKFSPQYVFINLTSIQIKFKVKEDQYSYPQTVLQTLNKDRIEPGAEKEQRISEQRLQEQEDCKEYIGFSNAKLKRKQILKQLFEDYAQCMQIFAGKLDGKPYRSLVYESSPIRKSALFDSGILSGYGSDADQHQLYPKLATKCLEKEESIKYSMIEYEVFTRVISVERHFSLMLLVPTVQVINKSEANFFAKSSGTLLKINRQKRSYVLVNPQGLSLQACQEKEDIDYNEWIRIKLQILGTIYYEKEMSSNGYESKQYVRRKKRMKRAPKIFYRIVLSRYQYGFNVLIEESQYPPITIINKSSQKIKVQETYDHHIEQLGQNQIGEYSSKDLYHRPQFKLFLPVDMEYRQVCRFGIDDRKNILGEQGKSSAISPTIAVNIQQYKSNIIIVVRDESDQFHASFDNSQLQLQDTRTVAVLFEGITLALLSQTNNQIMVVCWQSILAKAEYRNNKEYYKVTVNNLQGLDYTSIQPSMTFYRKNTVSKQSQILHNDQVDYLSCSVTMNYHRNATMLEKCQILLLDSVFCLSGELLLSLVKVYYHEVQELAEVVMASLCSQKKELGALRSHFLDRDFIIESFTFSGMSLTLKAIRLDILENFVNKTYEKLILKFICWNNDIRPIHFEKIAINYEQSNLRKMLRRFSLMEKHIALMTALMDYPLNELRQILVTFNDNSTVQERVNSIRKIYKAFESLLYYAFVKGQNKINKCRSYSETFLERHAQDNMINKMLAFSYAEWRYNMKTIRNKLPTKIARLQRYSPRNKLSSYSLNQSRIKLALDSHFGNKIYRRIDSIDKINPEAIIGFSVNSIVIYYTCNDEWYVISAEQLLQIALKRDDLVIMAMRRNKQEPISQLVCKDLIEKLVFYNCQISAARVNEIKNTVESCKLACQY